MSTVWVVNFSGHKIRKAEEYGEIKILTRGKVNVFQGDRVLYELADKLKEVKSDDYILISGTPILNVFVMTIVLLIVKKINYLLYDAKDSSYVVRTMVISDVEDLVREVKNEYKVKI